jgi:hypothetical protein
VQDPVVAMADPTTSSRQFFAMSNAGGPSAAPARSIAKTETMAARAKMQLRIIGLLVACINDTPSSALSSFSN